MSGNGAGFKLSKKPGDGSEDVLSSSGEGKLPVRERRGRVDGVGETAAAAAAAAAPEIFDARNDRLSPDKRPGAVAALDEDVATKKDSKSLAIQSGREMRRRMADASRGDGNAAEKKKRSAPAAAPETVAASAPPPPVGMQEGTSTMRWSIPAINVDKAISTMTGPSPGNADDLVGTWEHHPGVVCVTGPGLEDDNINNNAPAERDGDGREFEGEFERRDMIPLPATVAPNNSQRERSVIFPPDDLETAVVSAPTSAAPQLADYPAPLVEGRRIDPDNSPARRRLAKRSVARRACLVLLVAVFAAAIGAIVGVLVARSRLAGTDGGGGGGTDNDKDGEGVDPPTIEDQTERFRAMERIIVTAGATRQEALLEPTSAQFRALVWMADEDARAVQVEDIDQVVQRYSVAVLYYATGGGTWKNNTNHLSERHECDWHGIVCGTDADTGVVKRLVLDKNSLTGTLPDEIFTFELEQLSMFRNNIGGVLPNSICKLGSYVKDIRLYKNALTSTIPSCVGGLENLRDLSLWENELTGTIPSTVNNLKELRTLDLSINYLTGQLTIDFERLSENLESVVLYDNAMSGSIPSSVRHFRGTDFLLGGRGSTMSGPIPDDIAGGAASRLKVLALWDMGLTGTIPSDIFRMRELVALALSGNKLTGTLPSTMGETPLPHLRGIGLEQNQLSGPLPASIGNITSLEALDIHTNNLNGTLEALGNLVSLKVLELSNNRFSGTMPDTFQSLSSLFYLSVSRNDLSGSLDILCDRPKRISLLSADCKAEVDCSCCLQCCKDGEDGCNNYLSSVVLIKSCKGGKANDTPTNHSTLCGGISW